eukprot:Awhi_evm3s14340
MFLQPITSSISKAKEKKSSSTAVVEDTNEYNDEAHKWNNNFVHYAFDDDIKDKPLVIDEIDQAIEHISSHSCVQFIKIDKNNALYKILFTQQIQNSCASYVGSQQDIFDDHQIVNLNWPFTESGGCGVGSTIHEILHALGLYHTQMRSDRDDFIDIHYKNIKQGKEQNFEMLNFRLYDTDYDVDSILHYHSYAFSSNNFPTITTKTDGTFSPQRDAMKKHDVRLLNRMYQCDMLKLHQPSDFSNFQHGFIQGNNLERISDSSSQDCSARCIDNPNCESLEYFFLTKLCRLNSIKLASNNVTKFSVASSDSNQDRFEEFEEYENRVVFVSVEVDDE